MHKRVAAVLSPFRTILIAAAVSAGCAAPQTAVREEAPPIPPVQVTQPAAPVKPSFLLVVVQAGDTLSSIASRYLGDPALDWLIADFNDSTTVSPGQELIVPLGQFERGGLTPNGYQTVPVLSYHKFSAARGDKMTVTASAFEEQMKFLHERGYRVISMDQLFDFLDFSAQIPKRSVVITIDDGWRSFYDYAFPVLKKYGYPATLFVYTDLITGSKKTLSWELVREMADAGIDIQCHTRTHRDLAAPDAGESVKDYLDALQNELATAAKTIKEKTNRDVKYLAYPFGSTNHLVVALLKKTGFRGAFTVHRGGNPFFVHNFLVGRSMVFGDMDLAHFEKNLAVFTKEGLK